MDALVTFILHIDLRADVLSSHVSEDAVPFANALRRAIEDEVKKKFYLKNALVSTYYASWAATVLPNWWEVRFLPQPRCAVPRVCMLTGNKPAKNCRITSCSMDKGVVPGLC